MHATPETQVFECRLVEHPSNDPERKRMVGLLWIVVIVAFSAMFIGSFWMMGIENWDDFQHALSAAPDSTSTPTTLSHSDHGDLARQSSPGWQPIFFLPLLFLLPIVGLTLWVRLSAP